MYRCVLEWCPGMKDTTVQKNSFRMYTYLKEEEIKMKLETNHGKGKMKGSGWGKDRCG